MTNSNKAIILLSGGLDSFVSAAVLKDICEFKLALTFDYGQIPFEKELQASQKICKYYDIEHKIIKLDWLNILHNGSKNSDALWVPNRNALFINIAVCFAQKLNYDKIVIGANLEEAQDFKDNSKAFIEAINLSIKESSYNKIEVIAPLIGFNKNEIVKKALELGAPMKFVYSCYKNEGSGKKHCGACKSCLLLLKALRDNRQDELIGKLF